jgi:hypothetical protein
MAWIKPFCLLKLRVFPGPSVVAYIVDPAQDCGLWILLSGRGWIRSRPDVLYQGTRSTTVGGPESF